MNTPKICPDCGAALPPDAPKGLCPKCLINGAVGSQPPTIQNTSSNPTIVVGQSDVLDVNAAIRYFGDYQLVQEIARGGMGVVYKARQISLNRVVALKMILAGQFASESEAKRFHTEAEAVAQLDHPNIVPIYEIGEHESRLYYSMKFVEGGSLSTRIQSLTGDPREAARLMSSIAKAVHYAHQHGILHRDLKPANILMDAQGQPHVTDFGLAKRVDGPGELTVSGAVMGTPHYMAPEQAVGKARHITAAADVYALGAILYQLLTGRPPFQADTPLEVMRKAIDEEPAHPSSIRKDVDHDLATISLKCLEKDPERRYASARELAEDLERWLNHEPIAARSSTSRERLLKWIQRKPVVAALSAAVAVALLVGFAGVFWQWRQTEAARKEAVEKAAAEEKAKEAAQTAQAAEGRARKMEMEQRKAAEVARLSAEKARDAETRQKEKAEYEGYVAKIGLASARIENREFGSAEEALDGCPANLRHWEWGYLKRLCHLELMSFSGNSSIFIAADGRRVLGKIFGASGVGLKVWDAETSQLLGDFAQESSDPGPLLRPPVFSADNRLVLVIERFASLLMLDLANRRELWKLDLDAAAGSVQCAAFSPDGKRVAIGRDEGLANVHDAQTGRELFTCRTVGFDRPRNHGKQLWKVAFSPDGSRLLTGGEFAVQMWDSQTGKELLSLPLRRMFETQIAFSPGGERFFTCERVDGHLWDSQTGKETVRFKGHTDSLTSVVFSNDGRRLLTASKDRTARVWDATNGGQLTLLQGHAAAVSSAVFSSDGKRALTASQDRTARLWDAESGRELRVFGGHSEPVLAAVFCPDGKRVLTSSADKTARIWSLDDAGGVIALKEPGREIVSAIFSPNGKLVLTASATNHSGIIYDSPGLWDAATGKALPAFESRPGYLVFTAFSPDGRRAITGSSSLRILELNYPCQAVHQWDTGTGQEITALSASTNVWEVFAFSPDAKRAYTASKSEAAIWDAETGRQISRLEKFKPYLGGAVFSPDGKRLLTMISFNEKWDPALSSIEGTNFPIAKIWNTDTGQEISTIKHYRSIFGAVIFLPDRRQIVGFDFSFGNVWDVETGRFVRRIEVGPGIFSPDYKTFCGSGGGGPPRIIDFETGQLLATLKGHREKTLISDFSPDGRRLLTSSEDGAAKLWDAQTGRELLSFKGNIGKFSHPKFSPDGNRVVNIVDGAALILSAELDSENARTRVP